MIPVRLRLRNFLSYGEHVDPLDFTSFQLACLSGKNGHGKSSLLDAITWALWGQARKADFNRTPDADLLRLNADDMMVEFTFLLGRREYQVERGFQRRGKTGKSTLEFRARDVGEEDFRLLTGSGKKETQQRIVETLGIDYRTFINSSFLQQGKADEFTRQPPKDRKDILCNILGLSLYEQLLEETKTRWTAARAELKSLESEILTIEAELNEAPQVERDVVQVTEQLYRQEEELEVLRRQEREQLEQLGEVKRIEERVNARRQEEKTLQQRMEEWKKKRGLWNQEKELLLGLQGRESEILDQCRRLEEITLDLNRLLEVEAEHRCLEEQRQKLEQQIEQQRSARREQLASKKMELEQIRKQLAECNAWINRSGEIEQHYREYQAMQEQVKRFDADRPAFEAMQQAIQETEAKIEKSRQALKEQIAERRGLLPEWEAKMKTQGELRDRIHALAAREPEFQQNREKRTAIEETGTRTRERIEQTKAALQRLDETLKETQEKIHLLEEGASTCPVCSQPLDESSRKKLLDQYARTSQSLRLQSADAQKELARVRSEREDLLQQFKRLDAICSAQQEEVARLPVWQENARKLEAECEALSIKKEEWSRLEEQLAQNAFAVEARAELESLQARRQSLTYQPDEHARLVREMQTHQAYPSQWERLQESRVRRTELESQTANVDQEIAEINITLKARAYAQKEQKDVIEITQTMQPLQKELERRSSLYKIQEELRNAPAERQRLEHAKIRLPELEQEIREGEEREKEARRRLGEIQEECAKAEPALKTMTRLEESLRDLHQQQERFQQRRNELNQQLGAFQEKKARLEQRRTDLRERKERQEKIRKEERLYEILKTAFSRDGIPALIVEQSLPELENDANLLLRRLTNGSCTVKFLSQREKKSGDYKETLDILISDEMGTRDYDLYSGGEAFRTDLAIRIALSQLLCRRAGSQLQLLVIDEGFGTQDTEGLSHIVDAIDDIKDDFEKVLVVTHIEELKERFKDRIEVTKEPGIGSRFQVIHTY